MTHTTLLRIRRTFGLLLAITMTAAVTTYANWNMKSIAAFINASGGIWFLLAVLVGVSLVIFVGWFWPRRWPQGIRTAILIAAAVTGWLFGGDEAREAILGAPWLSLGIIVGAILVVWLIYGLVVPDKFPVPRWLKNLASRMSSPSPAPASTTTP